MPEIIVIKWGDGWKAFLKEDTRTWQFNFDMVKAVKALEITIGVRINTFTVRLPDWERPNE